MSVDNRTVINDCEANTGWTGDDAATVVSNTGEFYEGSNGLSWQASNASEQMHTTEDSVATGTFSVDWSDSTLYMLIKDNLTNTYTNGGVEFVIGDGTDLIGYDIAGNDAVGLPLATYYKSLKLDVSVVVATPGANTAHTGSEANLDQTACTQIGYGCLHLAKANGPSDNVFMDSFSYIANDSYALTINGGTSGTPETSSDVAGDDITNGWGMVSNPLASAYYFFAPTEWGNATTIAEHAFEASDEQWFWLGDNGGGRAVGATHFPMRLVSNATDTGSFTLNSVVIVNTGTGADVDAADANFNTIEVDGCSISGWSTFSSPSTGGTSRFWTNTQFTLCGQTTHNGADMSGNSYLTPSVAAGVAAVLWNETTDPNNVTTDSTFTMGANDHPAYEFGTSTPATITLTGNVFSGFSASNALNNSVLYFRDTGSDVNWTVNVSGGSGTVSYRVERGTDTVTIVSAVSITLTGLPLNTEVRLYLGTPTAAASATELDGVENSGTSFAASFDGANSGSAGYFAITSTGYENTVIEFAVADGGLPSSNQSIPVSLQVDRTYSPT